MSAVCMSVARSGIETTEPTLTEFALNLNFLNTAPPILITSVYKISLTVNQLWNILKKGFLSTLDVLGSQMKTQENVILYSNETEN